MSKIPAKHVTASPSKIVFRSLSTKASVQQRNSVYNPLKIGDRVTANGKSGTIAFIGSTKFAEGEWIGINLDEPQGKNDGSHGGVRYFETDTNHGLFCRPDKVQRLSINGPSKRNSLDNLLRISSLEGASNNVLGITTIDKSDLSSTKNLQIGDRVIVRGTKIGTLKYIGKIHIEEGIWCGIKLDGPLGKHDGQISGKRYFKCPARCGLFAPLHHVEKVALTSQDIQRLNRQSTISTDSNNQYLDSASQDSNLSEFSTSSKSLNDFPTRSPKKIKQPDLSAIETSLSSEIKQLHEVIKEKDLSLEKLQREYAIKENENENLIKERLQLTQHVEELQFQLQENQSTIPDDHRFLSLEEMSVYEKTEEKIVKLELINKKLLQEKQMFEEQLKRYNEVDDKRTDTLTDELNKQIALLRLQITDLENKEQIKTEQLTEKETFYQQKIEEYQSNIEEIMDEEQNVQLQLTSLEREKQTNEKRVHDLLDELNRHKENIVPDLENQCQMLKLELQNQNQKDDMALNERELYYEQQIKEYQANINQATLETEKIREELRQIQEENHSKEIKSNALINELKQNYEQIQTELNDRERQVDRTVNQDESHYEKQMKEYENNLNQATTETQHIRTELAKLEEEKVLHDNKTNMLINSLKQDYERQYEILQNQLNELQTQGRTENVILNDRIAHYEIEIKEYQIKIDQDDQKMQNLLDELKSLQEEKISQEQKLNKTIETLKSTHQELRMEIDELNERERKAHKTLHQREGQFDQQITEYREKLEQANLTNQHLQSELEKLQEEKTNFKDTITSLTQNLETLKTELQDRDRTENTEFNEHEAKKDQSLLEIQDLQTKLTNLQEEKITMENELNETIDILKQNYEKFQNDHELETQKNLHQHEAQFEQQITEYREKLEQADSTIQHLQSELEKLQAEKTNFKDTITSLTQNLEILKTELQNRDRTEDTEWNEREAEYKSKADQSLLEIQNLQSKVTNLQVEKTRMENELNETIDILKQNYEKFQNDHELETQKTLHQHEAQFEQQITEYQEKLKQSDVKIQHLQSELEKLQAEKTNFSDTIHSLTQNLETLKTELQDRDRTENTELNEREAKRDQSLLEIQDLQSKLTNLQAEKTTMENELAETIGTLKQNYEKLQNEQQQKEKIILKECRAQYEQEIDEYQKNLELSIRRTENIQLELTNLQEEKESIEKTVNDRIDSFKADFENQIQILKTQNIELQALNERKEQQLKDYQLASDETKQLSEHIEHLTQINTKLQEEVEDLKNQNDSTEHDQLLQQINDLQQMHMNLLEKQANKEQQYIEAKNAQEKKYKEKIDEFEMKIAMMKNEYMVEMENNKLDHDQEILRLKAQIPKLPPAKGKK